MQLHSLSSSCKVFRKSFPMYYRVLQRRKTVRQSAGIACRIFDLWQLLDRQKSDFRLAMRDELPVNLRNVLGKGYGIASLCMTELSFLYDQLKSHVEGSSLPVMTPEADEVLETASTKKLVRRIRNSQYKLLGKYNAVLAYFEKAEANPGVLKDHIFVLKGLSDKLRVWRREASALAIGGR